MLIRGRAGMHPQLIRLLLHPQAEGGGGGETATTEQAEAKAPNAERAKRIINKYGGAEFAVMQLMTEKFAKMRENDELRAKLPKEGSVVLTPEEAADWKEYRSLGPVAEMKKAKKDSADFAEDRARREREAHLLEVAEAAAIPEDRRRTFLKLALPGEHVVKESKDAEGKVTKSVVVKQGDAEVDFAAAYKDDLPVLRPVEKQQEATSKVAPRGGPRRPSATEATPPAKADGAQKVETPRVKFNL